MSDTSWLDYMGIGSTKPTKSNCPKPLSRQVKSRWSDIVENNSSILASLNHEDSWKFVLNMAFDNAMEAGIDWLDPSISGRPAQEKLALDVKARRALTVAVMDTTKALSDLTIGSILRNVTYKNGCLILDTVAECKLARNAVEVEWLTKLVKNRFKLFGYTYRLFGLPSGSVITFENHPSKGIIFKSTMTIATTFIPSDAAMPLVSPEVVEDYVVKKVWLPAIRTFKYKTARRKNSLL